MTLVEVLVVVMIVASMTAIGGTQALSWLRSEQLRGAAHSIYVQFSLARVEAANRNRPCRFVVDTATGRVQVIDLRDPANLTDDELISNVNLGSKIQFARPDGVAAVTLNPLTTNIFETTFAEDGSVQSGTGAIGLGSGAGYRRVSIFAGGATGLERWTGSAWKSGT